MRLSYQLTMTHIIAFVLFTPTYLRHVCSRSDDMSLKCIEQSPSESERGFSLTARVIIASSQNLSDFIVACHCPFGNRLDHTISWYVDSEHVATVDGRPDGILQDTAEISGAWQNASRWRRDRLYFSRGSRISGRHTHCACRSLHETAVSPELRFDDSIYDVYVDSSPRNWKLSSTVILFVISFYFALCAHLLRSPNRNLKTALSHATQSDHDSLKATFFDFARMSSTNSERDTVTSDC
ncbi:m161 [Muromegalovirus C4A]|uniref:M161 n=1 Tax=Muromegalovirus C4A TaxID=524649 RepID=B3UY88_MUHV1|nr:m161 [Muromegalovirus C4A]